MFPCVGSLEVKGGQPCIVLFRQYEAHIHVRIYVLRYSVIKFYI